MTPRLLGFAMLCLLQSGEQSCEPPQSRSGVTIADAPKVQKGADGLTVEQRNIADRLKIDNMVGSIKHLYVISAYSGQVLIYSTVRGKVTSSGKRLTPTLSDDNTFQVQLPGGRSFGTHEVLQDDGTYGSSIEFLYWLDSKGVYHQHYATGGQIIHISDQPLAVKNIVLNLEITPVERQ